MLQISGMRIDIVFKSVYFDEYKSIRKKLTLLSNYPLFNKTKNVLLTYSILLVHLNIKEI